MYVDCFAPNCAFRARRSSPTGQGPASSPPSPFPFSSSARTGLPAPWRSPLRATAGSGWQPLTLATRCYRRPLGVSSLPPDWRVSPPRPAWETGPNPVRYGLSAALQVEPSTVTGRTWQAEPGRGGRQHSQYILSNRLPQATMTDCEPTGADRRGRHDQAQRRGAPGRRLYGHCFQGPRRFT